MTIIIGVLLFLILFAIAPDLVVGLGVLAFYLAIAAAGIIFILAAISASV